MSSSSGVFGGQLSFPSRPNDGSATPPDIADDLLLQDLDDFFSMGKNTEHIRRFIEEQDDAIALAVTATDAAENTDSAEGLLLYQTYQNYAALVDGIIDDFVATRPEKKVDVTSSLMSAIAKEWKDSNTAYRLLCTSYIAAALDYKAFVEFAEDLYATTHYSMACAEERSDEDEDAMSSGSHQSYNYDNQ